MRRLLAVTFLALSSSAGAQDMPVGGTVRVFHDGKATTGVLFEARADSLVVRRGARETRLPRASMDSMFRRSSAALQGAAYVGVPMALIAGGLVQSFAKGMCGDSAAGCGADTRPDFIRGALVGGAVGALVGGAIGSTMGKWVPVYNRAGATAR